MRLCHAPSTTHGTAREPKTGEIAVSRPTSRRDEPDQSAIKENLQPESVMKLSFTLSRHSFRVNDRKRHHFRRSIRRQLDETRVLSRRLLIFRIDAKTFPITRSTTTRTSSALPLEVSDGLQWPGHFKPGIVSMGTSHYRGYDLRTSSLPSCTIGSLSIAGAFRE